jgi:hypothetical protein
MVWMAVLRIGVLDFFFYTTHRSPYFFLATSANLRCCFGHLIATTEAIVPTPTAFTTFTSSCYCFFDSQARRLLQQSLAPSYRQKICDQHQQLNTTHATRCPPS